MQTLLLRWYRPGNCKLYNIIPPARQGDSGLRLQPDAIQNRAFLVSVTKIADPIAPSEINR
jgi:hypothetical protein